MLDVGCGWGALVVGAAAEFGVTAVGVTLSGEQAEYAKRLAKEAEVDDLVTILHRDYREVEGTFDAIASVGMFEHVGVGQLAGYFDHLKSVLAPDGALLNHGIVTRDRVQGQRRLRTNATFVNTSGFPYRALVPFATPIAPAEAAGS